ncbi:MAG TPA: phosphoribosylformylglycinamidine synthase subunit PurQ, partial [Clostridia bacterium]|nr:phosphoribosylformylglycinamidine synthase subunit PurQ [Clostridia bacterium]
TASWFVPHLGSLVLEIDGKLDPAQVLPGVELQVVGQTTDQPVLSLKQAQIPLKEAFEAWSQPLEKVFPSHGTVTPFREVPPASTRKSSAKPAVKVARPRVLVTTFPGTNCEYDTARAFERAGAVADCFIMRNLTERDVDDSIATLVKQIENSQILMIPGGFSAGDEPDGSGKFIAAVFRNARVKDAVHRLLQQRDGLVLGICNGFQALIKLGLVPYGEIRDMDANSPTLTFNTIGRHISRMVRTKVYSSLSPWLALSQVNDVHIIPVSHGEGRFVASEQQIQQLFQAGQVATLYVDEVGRPANDPDSNPNGSLYCIEGITSPDGRVLGKMAHSERQGTNVSKNVPGEKDQRLFESGVAYFRS